MRDGSRLKTVQFIQSAVDGRIGDKVERILSLSARLVRLIGKGTATGEAVVHLANEVRVTEGLTTELGRQHHSKLSKLAQLLANLDVVRLVEQHTQQRLRGARILDRLGGEKDVLRGRVVKGAVAGALGCRIGLVGRVLEQEDDAVDGLEGEELGGVEC